MTENSTFPHCEKKHQKTKIAKIDGFPTHICFTGPATLKLRFRPLVQRACDSKYFTPTHASTILWGQELSLGGESFFATDCSSQDSIALRCNWTQNPNARRLSRCCWARNFSTHAMPHATDHHVPNPSKEVTTTFCLVLFPTKIAWHFAPLCHTAMQSRSGAGKLFCEDYGHPHSEPIISRRSLATSAHPIAQTIQKRPRHLWNGRSTPAFAQQADRGIGPERSSLWPAQRNLWRTDWFSGDWKRKRQRTMAIGSKWKDSKQHPELPPTPPCSVASTACKCKER